MFSLESGASGWAALCWSMSWERRRAQARPAGPPPTMTTSASISGRSMPSRGLRKTNIQNLRPRITRIFTDFILSVFIREIRGKSSGADFGFLDLFDERGDDVEQVGGHAVVGDLEDGGLGILIDGDDGARALHADDVLDGAGDAQRQVKPTRIRSTDPRFARRATSAAYWVRVSM